MCIRDRVELLDVSENSNGSVKLNGKITTCEKDNCEAKFLWGESKENLLNSTETIKNLKEGDLFSFTLRNLKKGKPYYVQVEAKLETKTVKDSKIIKFITRPDRPALLKATDVYKRQALTQLQEIHPWKDLTSHKTDQVFGNRL